MKIRASRVIPILILAISIAGNYYCVHTTGAKTIYGPGMGVFIAPIVLLLLEEREQKNKEAIK